MRLAPAAATPGPGNVPQSSRASCRSTVSSGLPHCPHGSCGARWPAPLADSATQPAGCLHSWSWGVYARQIAHSLHYHGRQYANSVPGAGGQHRERGFNPCNPGRMTQPASTAGCRAPWMYMRNSLHGYVSCRLCYAQISCAQRCNHWVRWSSGGKASQRRQPGAERRLVAKRSGRPARAPSH